MAKQAPTYDLVLMLSPTISDELRTRILSGTRTAISSEGELVGEHDWGMRTMAYAIGHQGEAEYHLFQFRATPELLRGLERTLRISDGVVRFRIIRLAAGTPPPPEMRPRRPEGDAARPAAVAPVSATGPVETAAAPAAPAPAAAPAAPAPAESG